MLTSLRGFDLPIGRLHPADGSVSPLFDRGAAQEGNSFDAAGVDQTPDAVDKAISDALGQLGGVLKNTVRDQLNKGQPPPPPGPKFTDLVMIGAAVTAGVVIVAIVVAAFRK